MEKFNAVINQEPESFIVQNCTLSYHFVSDISLSFAPKEVKDLTWEDPIIIKKSRNLKDALRTGYLIKLTPDQYEKTMDLQYKKEKKQLERDQQRKATTVISTKNQSELREKSIVAEGDLLNPDFCNQITKDIDVVFHCAAKSYGAMIMETDPMALVS